MKNFKCKMIVTVLMMAALCSGCKAEEKQDEKDQREMAQVMKIVQPVEKEENVVRNMEINETENVVYNVEESKNISMIGDSIMLSAEEELQEWMPDCVIDARKSRQVAEGIEVAEVLEQQKKLGDVVIIALGTNGPFTEDTAGKLLAILGEERTIFWVNVYGLNISWQDEVNEEIRQTAEQYSNVSVLDWKSLAGSHEEWFCEDGVHLNQDGQAGYAEFIYKNFETFS